jgi:hypothetical protein
VSAPNIDALERLSRAIEQVESKLCERYLTSACVDLGDGLTLHFKKIDSERGLYVMHSTCVRLARSSVECRTRAMSAIFALTIELDAAQANMNASVEIAVACAERWLAEKGGAA